MSQSEVEKRINKCISMNKCFVSLRDLNSDNVIYVNHEFGRVPVHKDFTATVTINTKPNK